MRTLLNIETKNLVALDEVINNFLTQRTDEAKHLSPYYQDLWLQIGKLLTLGGKRLRPQMCILSYQSFGGQDANAILPAAAAFELLHLSMLVHDDIIDRDYVRYGIDNISGTYEKDLYKKLVDSDLDRRHYADSAAMLGGDLLLSEAYMLVAQSNVSAEHILIVQQLMRHAIFEGVGGELLDTESAFRGKDGMSAELIALYKTASYTFMLPLLAGAYFAGLSEKLMEYVSDFGKNLGIAFQLRDDIIGVFGDKTASGKSSIADIREGKSTYMIEQFYILATGEQKTEFNMYFGKKSITQTEASLVRILIRESCAYDQVEAEIAHYEKQARIALSHLSVQEAHLESFEQLIKIATRRSA